MGHLGGMSGADGKAALERAGGRKVSKPLPDIGELVFVRQKFALEMVRQFADTMEQRSIPEYQ